MKTIGTVFKKEATRIFKDKRMLLAIFLPGILIYCIYSLLGGLIGDSLAATENITYKIAVIEPPATLYAELQSSDTFATERGEKADTAALKQRINAGELDLLADFSALTEENIAAGTAVISVFYSSTGENSPAAYAALSAFLSPYQNVRADFTIVPQDVDNAEDLSAMMLAMLAPMLLITFIFAGCLSLVPESIAGEKERGSFATMLVTPVKRSHIALGKIAALSLASLASGVCSALGCILSFPAILEGAAAGEIGISVAAYGFSDYCAILLIVASKTLVIVALMSLLSAVAKSVKEASGYASPCMLIAVVAAMANMFLGDSLGVIAYFIPLLGSAKLMGDVFLFTLQIQNVLIVTIENLAVTAALIVALAKMFDSEKIVS